VRARLAPTGVVGVQATSPLFARQAFWCIESTLEAAGLQTLPYRAFVPSFGEWGFIIGALTPVAVPTEIPLAGLRYLSSSILESMFHFAPDTARTPVSV